MILNRAKRYYHDNIEVLREKGRNRYRRLSEEEIYKKSEYRRNRYHRKLEETRQESEIIHLECIIFKDMKLYIDYMNT